jgi:hypothetical protein
MKRLLALFLLLASLFLAAPLRAADFYIAQSSAGSANGADCADAYAYTWMNTSGSWANPKVSGKAGPGDTIHLCGTISSNIGVGAPGSSGSPITILFEDDANLSQPYMQGGLELNNNSYIVVDGGTNGLIQSTLNGTSGGTCPGGTCTSQHSAQGIWATPCSNCEIKNLTIANMYVRTSSSDTAVDATQVQGISITGSNISVHNNTIHDSGIGIVHVFNNGDTDINIYNNNIYNNNWGEELSCRGTPLAGTISFYNNHVHDYSNWDNPGTNAYHHNGIHAFGTCQGASGGVWIYNNIFDGNPGVYVTGHLFFEEWSPFTTPLYIFNNVFNSSENNGWVVLYVGGSGSVIANNTFLNGGLSLQSGTHPIIKNNYLSAASGNNFFQLYQGTVTFTNEVTDLNYNYYCNCGNSYCWDGGSSSLLAATLSAWQTICGGCDGNSASNLTGTGGISTTTYQPGAGAAIIGAGVNLASLGITALDSDITGAARPSSGAWDIGAYQYTGGPPAPTGVRLLGN